MAFVPQSALKNRSHVSLVGPPLLRPAGSLVVVPDVAQLTAPGEKVEVVHKVMRCASYRLLTAF